jgi:hypothetical protein
MLPAGIQGFLRFVPGEDLELARPYPSYRVPSIVATKRYPRRGTVSTYRGLAGESPSASRILLTAMFRLWSKSPNSVPAQIVFLNCSRVITSPGFSSNASNTRNGWS